MLPPPEAYAALRFPHPFRRHQGEALEALATASDRGDRRAWVVLPPGAGKTLVGLETIRREGARRDGVRALVLSPNTAIQGQWVRGWEEFETPGPPVPIDTDRDLGSPVTSLTYQSLAVFDPERDDDDDDGTELDRLHPNGRELVDRLRAAGPVTLVLDECHHLLEVWGRLLVEILDSLPEATVLGLTATPPESLSADQVALVAELFGDIRYAASIPAVVREGHLAPFMDLVWLTTPNGAETEWLADQTERFAELTTALVGPSFGSTPFLVWADRQFAGEVPFERLAAKSPLLADAALRLRHAGLVELPVHIVDGEQHQQRPTAEDWALLIDGWYDACLATSLDDRDEVVRDALRRALPAVGYQLTKRGMRRGRSGVDRVLARSSAKSAAMVEIVAAEHRNLGDRLAMLVICDHESASATLSADLRGVLTEQAGSARLALAQLLADPATSGLAPVLVTGRTVAAAPATLLRLRLAAERPDLTVGEPDADGIAELTGPWSSRQWVRAVTDFFSEGECRVLVGTRALLGEGWDAPSCTGLIDLSMATTPGSVVQTRGRTLRLDPRDPAKVAVNWTICCVTEDHPKGDNDWERAVRKHQGYFGVDPSGDVVDGVAHVHPSFSPFSPPLVHTFGATNAEMLVRAERRADVRAAWAVGTPYEDEARPAVWLRPRHRVEAALPPRGVVAVPAPPGLTLGEHGLRWLRRPAIWRFLPAALLALGAVGLLLALAGPGPHLLVAAAALASALAAGVVGVRRRHELLCRLPTQPDLVAVAYAVADGLHEAGLTHAGAAAVEWHLDSDGQLRFVLDAGHPDQAESEVFARALAEMVAPIAAPRYLVPRYLAHPPGPLDVLRPLSAYRPSGVVWHPVPAILGVNAARAQAFAVAWQRWLGGGPPVFTQTPEGAGVLTASRGTEPLEATSVMRLMWS